MEVLDVLPYETAIQRLLRARVCSDEQLYDYQLSQALRSLAFAVNRPSAAAPACMGATDGAAAAHSPSSSLSCAPRLSTTGGLAVLCRLCALSILSASNARAAVFLSLRLLCDESSAFGEGNERPAATASWAAALSAAHAEAHVAEQMRIHRRMALGYVMIVGGTVREVARGRVQGKRLSSHYAEFAHRVFADVIPHLALMADREESSGGSGDLSGRARADATAVSGNGGDGGVVVKGEKAPSYAPSRLTCEANSAIIHIFYDLSGDMLAVHKNATQDSKQRSLVLDRDLPMQMWPVLSTLRRAIGRALSWIQSEAIGYLECNSTTDYREIRTVTDNFSQIQSLLEKTFSSLIKQQENLECASRSIKQQFGTSAKSFQDASEALWGNTLRLCFFVRTISSAWTHVHGGAGDEEVEHGEKGLLILIASFVSSVPVLEEQEKESEVFLATVAMLSAVLAILSAAPLGFMQTSLWEADANITQQIHGLIVHRVLRYRNETVQQLSALLSQLILYSSPASLTLRAITDSSEQLLDLLADGRDAASHCVIGMLTRAVVERPHRVIPALFRLLQHGDANTRRNALDVLAVLPEAIGGDSPYGVALTSEQMRPVLRLLAEELLLRVQDEELVIRLQSSKLFAKVFPEDVCRPLLRLAAVRDSSGRKQSAAQGSLSIVVEAHTGSSDILLVLIRESLSLLGLGNEKTIQATPTTPADFMAFSELHTQTLADTSSAAVSEENSRDRISRILYHLVRHWANLVPSWSETMVESLVNRVISAKEPLEQEMVVRVMSIVGSICSSKDEGAVALLSSCLKCMKTSNWLEHIGLVESVDERDSNMVYQVIAPLLCLGGCQRRAFFSKSVDDLPLPAQELWSLLWDLLLVPMYRDKLPAQIQRLVLEHVCKFSVHVVLKQLFLLDEKFVKINSKSSVVQTSPDSDMFSVCRIGYFCVTSILTQNSSLFPRAKTEQSALTDESGEGQERASDTMDALISGAVLTTQWTKAIVIPWLLSDDDAVKDSQQAANFQRLSRAAVESTAVLTILALNHQEFREIIEAFMLPLTELASSFRTDVENFTKSGKKDEALPEYESNTSRAHSIGRFEFLVHVHRSAFGLIRTHPSKDDLLHFWFAEYLPPFIELANASCVAVSALRQRDLTPLAAECCEVLFAAVMASRAEGAEGAERAEGAAGALRRLSPRDREALFRFAVGGARHAALPAVQAVGVRLLAALLATAPDGLFVVGEALEALGAMRSVALMHPHPETRAVAEQVVEMMEKSAGM